MKKIMTLVLALVMVFGVSAITMAESTGKEEIDIKMNVAETVKLIVNNGESAVFDLSTLTQPTGGGSDAQSHKVDPLPVTVQANTPVDITIENKFDPTAVGLKTDDLWNADNGSEDWIISPNVILDNSAGDLTGLRGAENTGGYNGKINASTSSKGEFNFGLWYEVNWNPDADWYKLEPVKDASVGNVTVTVAAQ